jgi:energy-converting hydrogenase Eha subunit B
MVQIGTVVSVTVAILLVLVAVLFDLSTAAFVAGIYLIVFAVYRLIARRRRT